MQIPRMRTILEACGELKKLDPGTAITPYFIRTRALMGEIPHVRSGSRILINLDALIEYLGRESLRALQPEVCEKQNPGIIYSVPENLKHIARR